MHHSSKQIYLDYNAMTPIDPKVFESMLLHKGEHRNHQLIKTLLLIANKNMYVHITTRND